MGNEYRKHFQLNPAIDYLNHGSFGAMPLVVWQHQKTLVEAMEYEPIEFLGPERSLLPKLDEVRQVIADLVNTSPDDLVFVRNATDGVNAVIRSLEFNPGDEIIITNHGYNACNNAVRFAADRCGANVVTAQIPFPIQSCEEVVTAVERCITSKSRFLLIDHVTSPSGLVFPISKIIQLARASGVRVMVDGAHGPGMVEVDLNTLEADYYTANHHKWLCGPKTSGFLYVRKTLQDEVRPSVISHGANTHHYGQSRFLAEFNWVGTYDPTPILAMPTAIQFLRELKVGALGGLMRDNRQLVLQGRKALLEALEIESPAPESMIGSLASVPLENLRSADAEHLDAFQKMLFRKHRIEVPVFRLPGELPCLRISSQAYNSIQQYERLAKVLLQEL